MPSQQSRRGFLFGQSARPVVRPPWADVERFAGLCTRCGACGERCPERIIVAGDGGFPEIDFSRGECTFCGACAEVCAEPIFRRGPDVAPWRAMAHVTEHCLTARGVYCQSCADACEPRAIRFAPRPGGVPVAAVSLDSCTGCGACVAMCPAGAIEVVYVAASHV